MSTSTSMFDWLARDWRTLEGRGAFSVIAAAVDTPAARSTNG